MGNGEPPTAGGLYLARTMPTMALRRCNRHHTRHDEALTGAALLQAGLVRSPQLRHMGHCPVGQVLVHNDLPALWLLAKEA